MTWYPPELTLRCLTAADSDRIVALSREANWNQTAADWLLMIEQGEAWGLWHDRQPVASALILPYDGGRFGWISMVLVSTPWRRRGLATGLLQLTIEQLTASGLTPGLDATEAGRPVYRKLGFEDIYPISRLALAQYRPPSAAAAFPGGVRIRPLSGDDMAQLAIWDRAYFGAERYKLLATLQQRMPHSAYLAVAASGEPAGFVLARDGRVAAQLGPLVAADTAIACALLDRALAALDEPVFIDAVEGHAGWIDVLQQRGFQRQRGFSRMLYRHRQPFDRSGRIFAIAGPELG